MGKQQKCGLIAVAIQIDCIKISILIIQTLKLSQNMLNNVLHFQYTCEKLYFRGEVDTMPLGGSANQPCIFNNTYPLHSVLILQCVYYTQ